MTRLISSALLLAAFALPTTAAADTWKVDGAHTQVGFSVSHMMVSTVRGTFGTFDGTVETDAKGKLTGLQGTVDITSVDTADAKRDEHLRSPDFFDAAQFPKMTFTSKAVKAVGDAYEVKGDLTIRGVTKPVTLKVEAIRGPITDPWGNVKAGTSATTTINRQDFGVSWNSTLDAGGVVVGDEVKITIDLEVVKPKG